MVGSKENSAAKAIAITAGVLFATLTAVGFVPATTRAAPPHSTDAGSPESTELEAARTAYRRGFVARNQGRYEEAGPC